MGYRHPGAGRKAAIEVAPVAGAKAAAAARKARLSASDIPALLIEGDNRPGLGADLSEAVAEAGINLAFLAAQVVGKRFSAVIGFEDEAASRKAAALIRKAAR